MKSLLDLPGPQFLMVYASMLGFLVVAGFLLRWLFRAPFSDAAGRAPELDTYLRAYLTGGANLAVTAAVARLISLKAVTVRGQRLAIAEVNPKSSVPMETAVLDAVACGYDTPKQIASQARSVLERLAEPLEQQGLIASASSRVLARWTPTLLGAAVLIFGIAKIAVGVSRGRPVGFLIALCVVCVVLIATFCRPVARTGRGDRLHEKLRYKNLSLAASARSSKHSLSPDDLAMAVALFGVVSLGTPELYTLRRMVEPNQHSMFSSWSSGSSGSSCGSSCSGGSSCGGGGCGGGGCGGCGS